MKKLRGIIGILAMIVFIAGFILWNFALRDVVTGVDVVVTAHEIQQGDVIKAEDLKVIKIDSRGLMPSAVGPNSQEIKQIIGSAALHPIPEGAQIAVSQFEDPRVVIPENEPGKYLYSIPSSWILSVPDTIRRLDNVSFYAVMTEAKKQTVSDPAIPADANIGGGPIQQNTDTINSKTVDELQDFLVKNGGVIDLRITCPVAYVKDGSNKEVRNEEGNSNRMNGTAKVSKIEVVATVEQVQAIEKAVRNGYKLILMYK